MGDAASARRAAGCIPLALALSTLVGACAHSTGPESSPTDPSDPRSRTYAPYFQGVKAQVNKNWDPNALLKARDPTGKQFAGRDRLTILEVKLDTAGGISAMKLSRSSGLDFLDEAAMDAFRPRRRPHRATAVWAMQGMHPGRPLRRPRC